MRLPENTKPNIFINVYSASAEESGFSGVLGLVGVYHSGVQMNGVEYAFAGVTGIYECRPGDYGTILRSIDLGVSEITNREIDAAIFSLRRVFLGDEYHIVLKNCNHFSDALARACTGNGIPGWINRAAWFASWCRCLIKGGSEAGGSSTTTLLPPLRFQGEGVRLSNDVAVSADEQRRIRLRTLDRQ